ncbi:MAG TPA: hypothetical protein VGR51_09020, partial [Thermoplasmata archaeon]|nr:hypothetical protein [Thermoplasmata archaeon]
DYFLAPFNQKGLSGGFLTITGPPRMGKTNIGCLYGEMWREKYPASEVLTNIPLQAAIPNVRPVESMPPFLRGIAEALLAARRWLWIFDEPALSGWMKADAPSARAKNLERFARIIPKLGGSFIYIEQRIEGVPTVIHDFAESHVLCLSPGLAIADLPARRATVSSIPRPSQVKYRTGESGYFDIAADFPFDGLFRALQFDPSTLLQIRDLPPTTQGQRILRFLEEIDPAQKGEDRPPVRCIHCHHEWIPRKDETPARCPGCFRKNPLGAEGLLLLHDQTAPT